MAKYRRKPVAVEIEADQFLPPRGTKGVCCAHPSERCPHATRDGAMSPHVHTIHHSQPVFIEPGDYIVPERDGIHFYPIKPDIFAATYEPV